MFVNMMLKYIQTLGKHIFKGEELLRNLKLS